LCREWNWINAAGRLKDFAAMSFLKKLEARDLITLPPIQKNKRRPTGFRRRPVHLPLSKTTRVFASLKSLSPLSFLLCQGGSREEALFDHYLYHAHYLGFNGIVGENLKYLVRSCEGRDLACVLFGSSAWKVKPRDLFIGWTDDARRKNLNFTTNNTRFLILPWVVVPHLASHILSGILRRLSSDWQSKYGHPIHLVETFVEKNRFRGTCYKAANWIHVGETRGRSRQDRENTMQVPIKDIFLYPLHKNFRESLCRI